MVKRVYVFDNDVAIREILWKAFKPRGYLVSCHPRPVACPDIFFAQLDCDSGRSCARFILTSIDFPDIPRFELIKNLIDKKHCKVKNIGLMSATWADTDLEVAQELGCEVFWKPFTIGKINSWIDACEEKDIRLSKVKIQECAVLQH